MKKVRFPGLLFLLCVWHTGQAQQPYTPVFQESREPTHDIPEGQEYTFGYLSVPENRSNPGSRTIQIPIYIFKSRSADPKPDPILYTVGGPGATTMPSARYMKFYKYLDDRDFILVEQRGTSYSKPHLECPEWAQAIHASNLPDFDPSESENLFEKAARDCRERLAAEGTDLDGYNTNEIAEDIADLVKALGIETYNLLTISYSTKIAQVMLRDHPQGLRSVVMDSPLPLEVSYDEESVKNLMEAVDLLLSDCEENINCNAAFPDLKARFYDFLSEKSETPLEVTVENPVNQDRATFKLRGEDLIAVFTEASTGDVPGVPLQISRMLNGDLGAIKDRLASLFEEPGTGAGMGMRLSVWCAEEFPFSDPGIVEWETHRHPQLKGLCPAVFDSGVCEVWGVRPVPDIENQPVKSDVPVLLINGEYDNETPPKWAALMKENLRNSHHLIFQGWKHTPTTNWGNPCAMSAANEFFNNPSRVPDPDCLTEIKATDFKTE